MTEHGQHNNIHHGREAVSEHLSGSYSQSHDALVPSDFTAIFSSKSSSQTLTGIWHRLRGDHYLTDIFPTNFTDAEGKYFASKYKDIPEEFYTFTGLPVVTPHNINGWISIMTHFPTTDLQEFCSGSGRLSLGSLYEGLTIAFPVDFRYQWDLRLPQHRKLLDQLDSRVSFYAPRCGPWSSLSNRHPAQTVETMRKEDEPFLQWIAQRSKKQCTIGNATVIPMKTFSILV